MTSAIIRRQAPTISTSSPSFSSDIPDFLAQIYRHRGLSSNEDINNALAALTPPDSLKGLDEAITLLLNCIHKRQRILIVGDFDADGATSCAVAIRSLEAMGHSNVKFLVPNRFEYGYGLTPEIVELAKQQSPHLIITVDNGISSIEGVAAAKKLGYQVVITDHHLAGEQLPKADAIINPNQPGCQFPSKALAGVGVIFYLMSALRTALHKKGWFEAQQIPVPKLVNYLDLVALGTVADVVPLDKNNRILVEQGLRRIRAGRACAGIKALIEVSGKSAARLTSADIGFSLGPRLNASGRLDDISIGIACLLTDDEQLAKEIALELDGMNQDRRQIEQGMQQQAEKILQRLVEQEAHSLPFGLALFDQTWHQGVVGILASRVKERYHRPTICFASENESEDSTALMLKGSARSIKGLHIRDVLDAIATKHPGLIAKFGGHAMAAGLSLKQADLPIFAEAFDQEVRSLLTHDDLSSTVLSDGYLCADDHTIDNAKLLNTVQPWGQEFPEPVFDGEFTIVQQRIVGQKHLKLVLQNQDVNTQVFDAIAFNIDPEQWPDESVKQAKVAYRLRC